MYVCVLKGSAIVLHVTKIKQSRGLTLQSFINAGWVEEPTLGLYPSGCAQGGEDISICLFVVIRKPNGSCKFFKMLQGVYKVRDRIIAAAVWGKRI